MELTPLGKWVMTMDVDVSELLNLYNIDAISLPPEILDLTRTQIQVINLLGQPLFTSKKEVYVFHKGKLLGIQEPGDVCLDDLLYILPSPIFNRELFYDEKDPIPGCTFVLEEMELAIHLTLKLSAHVAKQRERYSRYQEEKTTADLTRRQELVKRRRKEEDADKVCVMEKLAQLQNRLTQVRPEGIVPLPSLCLPGYEMSVKPLLTSRPVVKKQHVKQPMGMYIVEQWLKR